MLHNTTSSPELSTELVMTVARERFLHYMSQRSDEFSMLIHPSNDAFSGISYEVDEFVDLVLFLLASAEKVSNKQFNRARRLLSMCDQSSSSSGYPVQRLVHYFAEALRKRIAQETNITSSVEYKGNKSDILTIEEAVTSLDPTAIECLEQLPYIKVTQFTKIQPILDNVGRAKRVHLIDFGLKIGLHLPILMQALAVRYECPLELLKITVVGIASKDYKERIEETGNRLSSLAETMKLPFQFNVVLVSDMKDLNEDLFELDTGEVVAICSEFFLKTTLAQPGRLECLLGVCRNLRPCVMVVCEVEANTHAAAFIDRFIEALFLHSSMFDSFEACMDRHNPNRMTMERIYFRSEIQNIITTEGEERTDRHLKIDNWREIFSVSGMVEVELSISCLSQAHLMAKRLACGSSCTLDMNGKCLLVGWKGRPIFSFSAWKFHQA